MGKKTTLFIILAVLVALFAGGLIVFFYSRTFVSARLLLGMAALGGAIGTGLGIYASNSRKWIGVSVGFLGGALLITCGLLSANYFLRDIDTEHNEQATVIRKYTEQRSKTRRVGRRYISTGEKYPVYFLTLQFADGQTKEAEVTIREYSKTRTGSGKRVTMTKGFFGWPIYSRVKQNTENKPD